MLPSTTRISHSRSLQLKKALRLRQPCRGFKSSLWSAHMRSDMYRSLRNNRHRVYRWAYMASLKRGGDFSCENPNNAIKAAMMDSISQCDNPKSRYIDVNGVKSWSDDLSGVRIGRSIEDVEREAMNHLFGTAAPQPTHAAGHDAWRSPLRNIRNYLYSHRVPKEVTPDEVLRATTHVSTEEDSIIDPITNRRVPRGKGANSFTPKYDDVDLYGPNEWNEPDGLLHETREEAPKRYSDLHYYQSPSFEDPNKAHQLTPKEQSNRYNDLNQYGPQEWLEPDGLPEKTEEERSKEYEDLQKYQTGISWNEPDGLLERTPEERSKDYDDLGQYKASVQWNEPDGLRKLTPEEESKQYEDLADYMEGFVAADAALKVHEQTQQETIQKGQPLASKHSVPIEDVGKKYDDLDRYGPVMWNEPDGLRKLTPEEESKNYNDLEKYGAYQGNEPDGLEKLTPEEKSKEYNDLPAYGAFDNDGPVEPRIHPEEASKVYKDLPEYMEFENGDPEQKWAHPEESSKYYGDVALNKSYNNNGPEVERIHPKELSKSYEDLQRYDPQQFDSPYEARPLHPEETTISYKELNNHKAIFHNEADGLSSKPTNTAADGLGTYDARLEAEETRGSNKYYNEPEAFTAQEIRASVLHRAKERNSKDEMEDSKAQSDMSWDAIVQKARQDLRTLKSKDSMMTGNYARDFPEEFATSWSTSNSVSKSCLFPQNQVTSSDIQSEEAEQGEAEISSMDESFPTEPGRLQTAVSRGGHRRSMSDPSQAMADLDPYSTEPQGLQTSYAEEVPNPTMIVRHYEAEPEHAKAEAAIPSTDSTQTSYIVLAYDPSTQSIQYGSTTSSVADNSSPLSPAEILPRMSSPSKFLSEINFLQRLGYEMISGSGDVMVFRKGRISSDDLGAAKSDHATPFPGTEGTEILELLRRRQPQAKPRRRLGRKLLFGTAWIVGGAYAVGVLAEYFSTGGFDSLSSKGF